MKILVSSNVTQGQRENDFCFTAALEVLRIGVQCHGETVDGKCGCRRSLVGVNTMKATTTFVVVDLPITIVDYKKIIYDSLITAEMQKMFGLEAVQERAVWIVKTLLKAANQFEVGDYVERRGDEFKRRPAKVKGAKK